MSLVPRHILELPTYKPGRPIEDVRRELGLSHIIKLASNENPYGASPKALEAVQNTLSENFRYPDATALRLREKLSLRFDIKVGNVVVGAGSVVIKNIPSESTVYGVPAKEQLKKI